MKTMDKFLVSGRYNRETDNPIYVFLNTETQELEEVVIPKEDSDSCFKQKGLTEEQIYEAVESQDGAKDSIKGIDWITQYDLLEKRDVDVARVRMHNASQVGKFALATSNESHIKRVSRHAYDKKWYFGMPYSSDYKLAPPPINPEYDRMLEKYNPVLRERILQFCLAPIPDIKRKALDIEVFTYGNVMPSEREALNPVISVAVEYSDDMPSVVYTLSPKARGQTMKNWRSNPMLTELLRQGRIKAVLVQSETELFKKLFINIRENGYPLMLSFYGNKFDFPYLYNRAKLLGFTDDDIPFKCYLRKWVTSDGKYIEEWSTTLDNKLHLDLNLFLKLAIVKNYVFKNVYNSVSLEETSQALLGVGKFKRKEDISHLPLADLIYYNYYDSNLTMRLTQFDDEITMKIVFLFMRLSRQTFNDGAHRAISSKLISLLFGHMIEQNILIPSKEELSKLGTIESVSQSGKQFEGAHVIDPKFGVHFNSKTMDFTSLYPTLMANKNVSFETMNCGHIECMNNPDHQIPGLTHYTCSKYEGIYSQIIGLITDIRKNIFKPKSKTDKNANAIEQALKVFIVASFGVTGNERFGLYCPPAGESTTALGRDAIMRLEAKVRQYPGVEIIFGDTDSVCLKGPGLTKEVIKELQQWSEETLDVELVHEYSALILVIGAKKSKTAAKKNYFYIEEETFKIVVKGMSGKKRNTPKIVSRCFYDALDRVAEICKTSKLFGQYPIDEDAIKNEIRMVIIKTIQEYFNKIWNKEGEIDDYAITTQMTRAISTYIKTVPRHVVAAKELVKYLKHTAGRAYRYASPDMLVPANTFVQYICKAKSGTLKKSKDSMICKVDVVPVPTVMATKDDISPEKYHSILVSVMGQIMAPFGITDNEVATNGPFQPTLESFF